MKILKRILLALAVLIVAVVVIFNQNIPAFVYNEIEWRERVDFLLMEELRKDIGYMVDIRTGRETPFLPDEIKMDKIPEKIEKALDLTRKVFNDYEKLLGYQDKIPFLPKKYKEYQKLKKAGFELLQEELDVFVKVKEIEHKGFRLVRQSDFARQKFTAGKEGLSDEEYYDNLATTIEVARSLNSEAGELYKQGIINEEFKNYVVFQNNKMIDFYEFITNPDNYGDEAIFENMLGAISQREFGVEFKQVVTNWHIECIDDLNAEIMEYKETAYEHMGKADQYYQENNLKNDLVSRLLSKISPKYPKNI